MSDTKKPLDLETAQQLYIAAGQPDQAKAAGFVIDAVRNTVQGEWGQSFVGSLENLLVKHVQPLSAQIGGMKADLQAEFRTGLSGIEQQVSDLGETLDGLRLTVVDHAARLDAHDRQLANHTQRLDGHDTLLKLFAEWRGKMDEWRKQLGGSA